MNIEEIVSEFESDVKVNKDILLSEQINNSMIQSKYIRYWTEAKRNQRNLESAYAKLRSSKWDYFAGIPNEANDNRVSPIKRSTKEAIERSVCSDPDIITALKAMEYAKTCVDTLDLMIKAIKDRGFHIGNAIKMKIFEGGG